MWMSLATIMSPIQAAPNGSTPRHSRRRRPWTLGNAPRYFSDLRAPGYKNLDISIQKYFPIKESVRLQFRLDMFNAFNHTNFYSPNTFDGTRGFGTITSAWTPRQMQAALKFYW